jgi:hypothetical protein
MSLSRRAFVARVTAGLGLVGPLADPCFGAEPPRREPALKRFPTVEQIRASQPDSWKLVDAINAHRRQHGLAEVPLSPRLTAVAYWHAKDLAEKRPHETLGSLHSWSQDPRWRGGAYRPDDKNTWKIMWDKPQEISGFPGLGFEISAGDARDCEQAFELWTRSENHHQVILSRGVWSDPRWRWRALGAVFYKRYACAWFGNLADS